MSPINRRILTVAQASGGNDTYSSLKDAARAAQPGNIIEIADDGPYEGGLVISTNAQGLPLHGLAIKAAPGRSPIVAVSSATGPNIEIVGLRDVLIQGLHVEGGQSGIELVQPEDSQPMSATIDQCIVSKTDSAGSAAAGIVLWDGATAAVTRTTIRDSTGLGILISDGAHLTLTDSTVEASGSDGMDAFSANVQILRSSIAGTNGSGAYLESCSGIIKSSHFSGCKGRLGDGIEVLDGNVTVADCMLESNEQAGIYLSSTGGSSGAAGLIFRNQIRSNACGLYLNPGRGVTIEANFLKNNGRGMRLAAIPQLRLSTTSSCSPPIPALATGFSSLVLPTQRS